MSTHTEVSTHISPFIFKELLFDYLSEHKWMMCTFFVVILFTLPVEMVVLPRFYSLLFEKIRSSKTSSLPNMCDNVVSNTRNLSASGIIYIVSAIWVVVVIAYLLKNTLEAYIVPSYTSFIRQKMFTGTILKHSDNYKDLRVGEHVTRLMDVSRNMKDLLTWSLNDIIPLYIAVCCLCVFVLMTNWKIGLVTTTGVLVHTLVMVSTVKSNIKVSAIRENCYLEMSEKIHDSFGNLMNVYINNMKNDEIESNNKIENRHKDLYQRQYVRTRNIIGVLSLITILTFVLTVVVTYSELQKGNITSVTFVSVWIILLLYLSNMMRLSDYIPHFINKLGIVACSNQFLVNILKSSTKHQSESTIESGDVEFQNIAFHYDGNEHPTLYNLNLKIKSNEKIAILGTSGSGKTTAMKLLNGMHAAQQGKVLIDGTDIQTMHMDYVRTRVNYVNQRTTLFNTNIIQNIQYGNQATDDEIIAILEEYGLSSVYSKLKEGVYTNAGVNGGSLSLGMQKVTILMRGLMRGGKIIVLDEPLAGLDSTTRANVMRFIHDTCNDTTLIVITHDKEILPMVDRVVQFETVNHTEEYLPSGGTIIETLTNFFVSGSRRK